MRHHVMVGGAAAMMGLLLTVAGEAGAVGTHPGADCATWNDNGGSLPDLKFSWGRVGNPSSTESLPIDCPTNISNGEPTNGGWMRVVDLHPSSDVSCTLWSLYTDGNGVLRGWWDTQTSQSWGSLEQTLQFPGLNGVYFGYAFYGCTIPPRHNGAMSLIASYRLNP